jgi:hypothetical protein
MTTQERVHGRDGWIRVGDLVTSDGYWAYEVLTIENGDLLFREGMPQAAAFYAPVDPARVDSQGRVISEENEAGRQRMAQWIAQQNNRAEEG